MGVRVPAPGRNSNLNALPRAKRARHQCHAWSAIRHDSSRVGSGDLPGPALGVVVARVARHAHVQEMALSIRQDMDLGAEADPVAAEGGSRLFFGARPSRSRVRA